MYPTKQVIWWFIWKHAKISYLHCVCSVGKIQQSHGYNFSFDKIGQLFRFWTIFVTIGSKKQREKNGRLPKRKGGGIPYFSSLFCVPFSEEYCQTSSGEKCNARLLHWYSVDMVRDTAIVLLYWWTWVVHKILTIADTKKGRCMFWTKTDPAED